MAMDVGLGVVLCFEVLSRMTLRLWASAELWTSAEGFLGRLCDEGCSVLVCPGTKFCSRLQSFALRGSAECRWDRGESSQTEVKSRWGREKRKWESESGCTLMKKRANGEDRVKGFYLES